jgi:hypothetical protein
MREVARLFIEPKRAPAKKIVNDGRREKRFQRQGAEASRRKDAKRPGE